MAKKVKAALVLATAPDMAEAEKIGSTLLLEGLAACVQYECVRSQYVWVKDGQNVLCDEEEVRLMIKTTRKRYDEVAARIAAMHSYECPQIVMLPIKKGFKPYLKWLGKQCSAKPFADANTEADSAAQ